MFLSASFAHQETVKSPKIKHKKIVPEAETRSVRDNTSNTCERALWVLRQRKRNGYLDITLKQAHREGRKKIESETLFGESERVSSSSRVDLFALGGEGFSSIPRRALIMKFSAKFNLEDREKALAGRTNIKRLTLLLDEACLLLNSLEKKSLAQEKYEAERFLKGKPLCGRPAKSRGTVSCEISACSACLGAESATERRFVNYKSCLWPRREKRFCEWCETATWWFFILPDKKLINSTSWRCTFLAKLQELDSHSTWLTTWLARWRIRLDSRGSFELSRLRVRDSIDIVVRPQHSFTLSPASHAIALHLAAPESFIDHR